MEGALKTYFTKSFKEQQLFSFSDQEKPLYQSITEVFQGASGIFTKSLQFAQHLYDCSNHKNIKPGELMVVVLENCVFEDEILDAIGIFKSESKEQFIKLRPAEDTFELELLEGINSHKLDKGAIIFNTAADEGYRVAIVDKTNTQEEARYWKEKFLGVAPIANEYFHTNQYLDMCKKFALQSDEEDRVEQIDLLNRSVEYFKSRETFDEEEFEEIVLQAPERREAFHQFQQQISEETESPMFERSFEISPSAVQMAQRHIRSVIKLDKNFHVYVHGNRSRIEKGFDEEKGLHYYKLFYEEES